MPSPLGSLSESSCFRTSFPSLCLVYLPAQFLPAATPSLPLPSLAHISRRLTSSPRPTFTSTAQRDAIVVWSASHGDCICLPGKWITTYGRGRHRHDAPPLSSGTAPHASFLRLSAFPAPLRLRRCLPFLFPSPPCLTAYR
jgi:hypothetical protein